MKIFAISQNGEMYQIGDSSETAKWHTLDRKVEEIAKQFKVHDEISASTERRGGSYCITYMGKPGATPQKSASEPTETTYTGKDRIDKGKDINTSIKKQAIAHATSRTIICLDGKLTTDNVLEVMEKIYKKYEELVG